MIDKLPYDIIKKILEYTISINSPLLSYRLKFVNHNFYDIIDKYDNKLPQNICDNNIDKYILLKDGNIEIFQWLFKKNYDIVYTDVSTMILCDRLDILNLMINYEKYNSILFNRFYLSDGNISEDFDIFHFGKCNRSYLLLACECDNLNIVKFLLENKVKSNKNVIYFLQINAVVDYCLKNKNLKILEYIYNNYKYKINQKNLEKIKIFKHINII